MTKTDLLVALVFLFQVFSFWYFSGFLKDIHGHLMNLEGDREIDGTESDRHAD